jgi:2-amino-4-hydroxy-6-hydroxymethyldihydropteridine diphosphokinase
MRQVSVAIGSNQGARESHLQHAVARLRLLLDELRASSFIETKPEGVGDQPLFLNGAVVGWSAIQPEELLDQLQAIECERGRERPFVGAPRTLDLDLILVGDLVVNTPHVVVPHPRFRTRRFVLEPLVDVAPDLVDPVTGRTMRELLHRLGTKS